MFSLPENLKVSLLYQGAANAVDCDVVNMKNFEKGWFVVIHTGSSDTDLVLTLYEATDVAAGTDAAVEKTCPIWADTDAGSSSDTLVRQDDAYAYTINTGDYPNQMVMLEWSPAKHTDGYDCVYLADSGGNASNVCTILFVGVPKWQGASLPTAITD